MIIFLLKLILILFLTMLAVPIAVFLLYVVILSFMVGREFCRCVKNNDYEKLLSIWEDKL